METSRLGRYELISRIGQGGMAEVRLALQRGPAGFEKLVVVKLINEKLAEEKRFINMLLDEARVAALVKHPNVVDIYDLGEENGRYFIAMEYLEGEPLLALLRAGREGKRLDALSTARLISETAEGLDAAHELRNLAGEPLELVHHDVSLGNVVVLYNGRVKLVDFGVARVTQQIGANARVHGKSGYMAPEKLKGVPGDRRSDIWSLGVVMWESLTLRRLFKGTDERDTFRMVLQQDILPPSAINSDIPPEFDEITLRALERDPDKRYATAREVSAAIEDVLAVHQYGRTNKIAKYMQETFAAHIVARRNLMREVSTKGTASAEVLDAVFHVAQEFSIPGELSIRFKRSTRTSKQMLVTEVPRAEGTPILASDVHRTSDVMMAEGTPHGELTPIRDLPIRKSGPFQLVQEEPSNSRLATVAEEMTREATPAEMDSLVRRSSIQQAIVEESSIPDEEHSVPIEMRPRLEPIRTSQRIEAPVYEEDEPEERRVPIVLIGLLLAVLAFAAVYLVMR